MAEKRKKTRGRPRLESNDVDVERRRKSARMAQSRMKDRKSFELTRLRTQNENLQSIIEELGTCFDTFSTNLMSSGILRRDTTLLTSLQHALETFAKLSKKVQSEDPEYEEASFQQSPQDLPDSVLGTANESMNLPLVSSQDYAGPPRDRWLTEKYPSAVVRLMPIQNPILSSDYWLIHTLSNPDVSFSQRLFRSALLESHTFLREWQAGTRVLHSTYSAHSYSFRVSNAATLLQLNMMFLRDALKHGHASGRNAGIDGIDRASEQDPHPDVDQEYIHNLGVQLRNNMAEAGVNLNNLISAEQVEESLTRKGMFSYDRHHIQIRTKTNLQAGNGSATPTFSPPDVILKVDVQAFINRLLATTFCLGDGVGFSESSIISCVLASLVEIVS